MTKITLLDYPPSQLGNGIHPHRISAVLISLPPDLIAGVRIYDTRTIDWISIFDDEESSLVNVGDILETWSGGRFISAAHKVELRANRSRYSFPYFLVSIYGVLIRPFLRPVKDYSSPVISAGAFSDKIWPSNWLQENLQENCFNPFFKII